jgi:hypothetical protein
MLKLSSTNRVQVWLTCLNIRKKDELKLMYRIFKRGVDVFKFMTIKVEEYINKRGKIIVNDEKLKKDPV